MKKFRVTFTRLVTESASVVVQADTVDEAEEIAELAETLEDPDYWYATDVVDTSITEVFEIPGYRRAINE